MVNTYSQVIDFCLLEYPKEHDKIDKAMWPATETFVKNKAEYCFSIVTDPTPKITDKMLTHFHKQLIFLHISMWTQFTSEALGWWNIWGMKKYTFIFIFRIEVTETYTEKNGWDMVP